MSLIYSRETELDKCLKAFSSEKKYSGTVSKRIKQHDLSFNRFVKVNMSNP